MNMFHGAHAAVTVARTGLQVWDSTDAEAPQRWITILNTDSGHTLDLSAHEIGALFGPDALAHLDDALGYTRSETRS